MRSMRLSCVWGVIALMSWSVQATAQQSSLESSDTLRLSLSACIEMSLKNNLSIKKSELNTKRSKVDVLSSYMDLLPSLSANAGASRSWGRSIDPTSNTFITQANEFLNIGSNSSLVIFDGLRNINNIIKSKVDLSINKDALEVQRNTTILTAVNLYLSVLLNKELLANANWQLQSTQEQTHRTEKLVETGGAAAVALLNLRAQAANNQLQLVQAQNALSISLLNLKQALLIPYEKNVDTEDDNLSTLVGDVPEELSVSVEDVYRDALSTRPEIRVADLSVRSAELQLRIRRANFWPNVSIGGNVGTNYSSAADRPRPVRDARGNIVGIDEHFDISEQLEANLRSSLGLQFSVPIFSRWNNRSSAQRAKLNYTRARIEAQEARNVLRTNIETAYNEARAALEVYRASEHQAKSTEESFRATETGYSIGTSSYTDYVIQRNTLYQARSNLLRAKYSFIFRKQILDFYRNTLTY